MAELTGPFELLELEDGQAVTFRHERHQAGDMTITTRDHPEGKRVRALRVYVPAGDKATFPPWWDLTATTLVAQLEPHLEARPAGSTRFRIQAVGVGKKKRFMVTTAPA